MSAYHAGMTRKFLGILACGVVALGTARGQQSDDGRSRLIFPPGAREPLPTPTPIPKETSGIQDPAQAINLFFLALKAGQVDAAYDGLVKNSIVGEKNGEITALKERTKQALDSYGPIAGYEVIEERKVGAHLLRRTCLSLNSDLPLRWRFYFYESGGQWNLVDLRVDDALVELFEDAAKPRK